MKFQKKWGIAAGLSVALVACGQSTPSLSFDSLSYGMVSKKPVSAQSDLLNMVKDNQADLNRDFYSAVFFPLASSNPTIQQQQVQKTLLAEKLLGGFVEKQSLQVSKQENCVPEVTGNTTDKDNDKIVVNAALTFNCSGVEDGVSFSSTIRSTQTDKNDNDIWGGFTSEFISEDREQQGGNQVAERVARKLNDTKQNATNHAFVAENRYDLLLRGTNNQGQSVNLKVVYTYKQDLTVEKVEDGHAMTVNGSISLLLNGNGSFDAALTFAGTLHASNNEVCKGIDSGTITFNSGGFTSTMVYTGCNQYTVQ